MKNTENLEMLSKEFTDFDELRRFMLRKDVTNIEVYGTKPDDVGEDKQGEWTIEYSTK